jgi:hypothetical protein
MIKVKLINAIIIETKIFKGINKCCTNIKVSQKVEKNQVAI